MKTEKAVTSPGSGTRKRLAFTAIGRRRLMGGLSCAVALVAGAGCQTFSMSEEDFQREQRGEVVDRKTGDIVAVVGSLGALGGMTGAAVAEALKK